MEHRLILYGSGKRCLVLCKVLRDIDDYIITVVDSDKNKWGNHIEEYIIESPEKIREFCNVNLCITISEFDVANDIRSFLQQTYDIDMRKEISYNKLLLEALEKNLVIKDAIIKKYIKRDSKQSILFDSCNGFGLGGVESWTVDVCKALIEDGIEKVYIISDNGNYNVPFLLKGHVIYININHKVRFSLDSLLNIIEDIIPKLPCKVITRNVDDVMIAAYLIKCYYPNAIEIISVIHDSYEKNCNEYIDFKRCSDFYIAVSQDIKNTMILKGIEPENISSITCPFNCPSILKRTYTEDNSKPIRIGYAGRMEYFQKRMDLVLELINTLVRNNVNFILEIAGDGIARKQMEEYVYYQHFEEKVKFLGTIERSKISSFWQKQDICINLADYEGRSISIIEAMGNGAIPIVTDTSGVREDIKDYVNGYVVMLGDYHTMASRIEYLSNNRWRLSEMGKLAHDEVYPKSLMKPHLEFWKDIFSRNFINGERV